MDFDNTIACYDGIFYEGARERGWIPENIGLDKTAVRDYLRRIDREELWTELQGLVYGPLMQRSRPFAGVVQLFRRCVERSIPVYIVSHRTRVPYLGEPYDLHQAAYDWVTAQGFLNKEVCGLSVDCVFFEETKKSKIERIRSLGCTHFVDDLPEFLADVEFPAQVERILFDPDGVKDEAQAYRRVHSWQDISDYLGI